jgi:undecaprenyl-diphosphatase
VDLYSSFIYGLIQGLTEFLPVSSSGHLALLPKILNIKDPGLVFDLSMHIGTAFSILLYFRIEVINHFRNIKLLVVSNLKSKKCFETSNMLLVTLSTFLFALLLKPITELYGRNHLLIGFNLLFFGILMFIFDYFGKSKNGIFKFKLNYKQSLIYGLAQAFAIFPGVSRSGITLTYSRLIGMDRHEATTFSFLLALPLILAGFVLKLPELLRSQDAFNLSTCIFGIFISFVVGLITIHFFLKLIKKIGLWFFSVYRIVLGLIILLN